MTHTTTLLIATITLFLVACGSLEKKSVLIGIGDDKEHVLKIGSSHLRVGSSVVRSCVKALPDAAFQAFPTA
jgi:hypothetical protein